MKRVWATARTGVRPNGFALLLDDKALRLPGGDLLVPFRALADAMALEWNAAGGAGGGGGDFSPDDLPLTTLANTALEKVSRHREDVIHQLAAYGMHDLLCYRAEAAELAAQEDEVWRPWLDWAASMFGAHLRVVAGVIPVMQMPANLQNFDRALTALTDFELAALGVIVPALGSLILGLAVAAGALSAEAACAAAHVDELWQEQSWGTDAAAAARRADIAKEVAEAARFMVLCKP